MTTKPIVYTIPGCSACVKLLDKWNEEGVEYEERRADLDQSIMEEARSLGDVVPIVVNTEGNEEVVDTIFPQDSVKVMFKQEIKTERVK